MEDEQLSVVLDLPMEAGLRFPYVSAYDSSSSQTL